MGKSKCLWLVVVLFPSLLQVPPCRCDVSQSVPSDFYQESKGGADLTNNPANSDFWETLQAAPDQKAPFMEPDLPLQPEEELRDRHDDGGNIPVRSETSAAVNDRGNLPVRSETNAAVNDRGTVPVRSETSAAFDDEGNVPVRSETSADVSNQGNVQGVEDQPPNSPSFNSPDASILHSSNGKAADAGVPDLAPDFSLLGHSAIPVSDNYMNKRIENGQRSEGQVGNSQDGNGFKDLTTKSSHMNEGGISVLGSLAGSFAKNDLHTNTEIEQKIERPAPYSADHSSGSAHNIQNGSWVLGVLGASHDGPALPGDAKLNQGGNVLNTADDMTSASSGLLAVPAENVRPDGISDVRNAKEDQQSNGFDNFEKYQHDQDTNDAFPEYPIKEKDDEPFKEDGDATRDENAAKSPDNESKVLTADGKNDGPSIGRVQQLFNNNSDEKLDEEQDEYEDFDDDEDGDEWWYYDPDREKESKTVKAPTSSSSSPNLPAKVLPEGEEWNEEKQQKEPSDSLLIHEGVIDRNDVVKMKKKIKGPKGIILFYTGLILVLFVCVVVVSLWKKKGRRRHQVSQVPSVEEGKRLLDHPFV